MHAQPEHLLKGELLVFRKDVAALVKAVEERGKDKAKNTQDPRTQDTQVKQTKAGFIPSILGSRFRNETCQSDGRPMYATSVAKFGRVSVALPSAAIALLDTRDILSTAGCIQQPPYPLHGDHGRL